jgi:lysine 6-dehydrogenase
VGRDDARAVEADGLELSTVAVVGAAGIIGPAIVATLAETEGVERILCLDLDADGARAVAEAHGGGRAVGGALDVSDRAAAAAAIEGAALLLNTAAYRINLDAMEVALAAGAHYLDLGGLYHVTLRQLELDARFRDAGLLAVLGMGSTPGKTNVMATRAVGLLGEPVERIVVGAAGRDPEPPAGPLVAPYAVETILDELTMPTPVVRGGEAVFLEPMTPAGVVEFGDPVGPAETIYTIHSEQATFAQSFGASEVSFQLSLNPFFLDKIRLLADLGLAGTEEVTVGGQAVVPRRVLMALLRALPKASPSARAFGIHRIEAHAASGRTAIVECVTQSVGRLPFGGGVISTACPPGVVAGMICRGELSAHAGALPSERCVPYVPLFSALERYGVSVREAPPA